MHLLWLLFLRVSTPFCHQKGRRDLSRQPGSLARTRMGTTGTPTGCTESAVVVSARKGASRTTSHERGGEHGPDGLRPVPEPGYRVPLSVWGQRPAPLSTCLSLSREVVQGPFISCLLSALTGHPAAALPGVVVLQPAPPQFTHV